MQTPTGRRRGAAFADLYGDGCPAINRRVALAGLAAAIAMPAAARGGAVRGGAVRAIAWQGRATVTAQGRTLTLVSRTRVELPLLRVRSTSWLVERGEATARTMILDPDGAWLERDGARSMLPYQLAIHERQQFAIYGWLVIVQQRRHPPGRLALSAPPYPDIVFEIGADGFPISAALTVDAPEVDKPRIAEVMTFTGWFDAHSLRWPRRFALAQDGQPYFTLEIESFTAT